MLANAKLIAAAPELLKALSELVYEDKGEYYVGICRDANVSDIVREVIKKSQNKVDIK